MPAQNFVQAARTAPSPFRTKHRFSKNGPLQDGNLYTCHMAVMHWAFMDLGDSQKTANDRLTAIILRGCLGCTDPDHNPKHGSLGQLWYGLHFCTKSLDPRINSLGEVQTRVGVGDVLIVGAPERPMHSMVVVAKNASAGQVLVRGFNNAGTLGTNDRDAYESIDHNIQLPGLWYENLFGRGRGALHVVPYAKYLDNAGTVHNAFKQNPQHYPAPVTPWD